MSLEESRRSQRPYRYGMVLLCVGALINWLGLAENYVEPVRYVGVACIVAGALLICAAMCCWLHAPPTRTSTHTQHTNHPITAQVGNFHIVYLWRDIEFIRPRPSEIRAWLESSSKENYLSKESKLHVTHTHRKLIIFFVIVGFQAINLSFYKPSLIIFTTSSLIFTCLSDYIIRFFYILWSQSNSEWCNSELNYHWNQWHKKYSCVVLFCFSCSACKN